MNTITFEEIKKYIYDYWVDSNNIKNIIDNLNFDNLVVENNIKDIIKKDIIQLLNEQYKRILFYENMSSKILFDKITQNKIKYNSDKFVKFIKNICRKKFNYNYNIICDYIDYSYHIQKLKSKYDEYNNCKIKKEYLKYEKKEKLNDSDYLKKYNIENDALDLYKKEVILKIIKEYDSGLNYRELVKKYHPDARKVLDDEYIKVVNYLRKEKIIK